MTQIYSNEISVNSQPGYVQKVGDKNVSPEQKDEMKKILLTQEWLDIRHAAKNNPALQKSVDHIIMLYRLIKNGNSET